jgi:Rod binding domain-containing protein
VNAGRSELPSALGGASAVAQQAALAARGAPTTREPALAGKQFEQLLAGMLVRELRRALPNGFFGQEMGADTYESWLDEHLGRALSESGALGIAGMVKVGLERQGAAPAVEPPPPAIEPAAARTTPTAARGATGAQRHHDLNEEHA